MKRLVKEAANMTDAQKKLGVVVDESSLSFANIVDAISVVQYEMGIYGATAQEAEHTISGSINAMKSAWQNLVTVFADPEADLGAYVDRFVDSVIVAKDNIVPRIKEMLPRIVDGLGQLVDELGPEAEAIIGELLPSLINGAANMVANLIVRLPGLLADFGVALKDALVRSLDDAGMSDVADKIESVFEWVVKNKDGIVAALEGIGIALLAVFAVGTITKFAAAITTIFSPLGLLVAVVATVAAAVIENWDRIKESWNTLLEQFAILGDGFSQICDDIGQWFSDLVTNLSEYFQMVGENFQKFGETLAEVGTYMGEAFTGFLTFMSELPGRIGEFLAAAITAVTEWAISMATKALETGQQFVRDLVTGISSLASDVFNQGVELLNQMVSGLESMFGDIVSSGEETINQFIAGANAILGKVVNVGKNVVAKIKEGISSAWDGLKTWFSGLWDGVFSNLTANVTINKKSVNSSNAIGLDYVPFNGYIAELHRGEMVLTSAEADAYRRGNYGNSAGITIVQNIQSVPQTPVELAAATQMYFEQARWVI